MDTESAITTPDPTHSAVEVTRLQKCIGDLIVLLAIPAAGAGQAPADVLDTVLDVLVATLRLDFACGLVTDPIDGPLEVARWGDSRTGASTSTLMLALAPFLSPDGFGNPGRIADPGGHGEITVTALQLGLFDPGCVLVAGSRRVNFPDYTEQLLLRVAVNQAALALQEARRLRDEKRRARERVTEERFEAMLEERTRLAREMHDTLLQGFTGVALQLAAVAGTAGDLETLRAELRAVIALAQRTLVEARLAIWGLREPDHANADLTATLEATLDDVLHGTDLLGTLDVDGHLRRLAPGVEQGLVRVAREALSNVVRHAAAREVAVHLHFSDSEVRLIIRDDGVGFVVQPEFAAYGGHWGLLGMRERAMEMRGSLTVRSVPQSGTEVVLCIPCPGESAAPA